MTVLVAGPGGDEPANQVLQEIGLAVCASAPPDSRIVQLWGEQATRERVDAVMAGRPRPDVFYFGHGEPTSLGDGIALIDADNVGEAYQRVVLAMACWSATSLGEYAVHNARVGAYLGFSRPVIIPWGKYAHWRLDPWCAAGDALLQGETAGSAAQALQTALQEEADRLLDEVEDEEEAVEECGLLMGWAHAFQCLGEADTRLGAP